MYNSAETLYEQYDHVIVQTGSLWRMEGIAVNNYAGTLGRNQNCLR